jgi:Iap family predicted aminopeptidase
MLFVKAGIPTMAITSTTIFDAVDTITHTPDDTPEKLDPERIVELANFLHQLLHNLNNE